MSMAKSINLAVFLLFMVAGSLLICGSGLRGSLWGFYDVKVRDDTRSILNKYGFDEPVLKYYWRRAMLEDRPTRLAPGGPDGHHH